MIIILFVFLSYFKKTILHKEQYIIFKKNEIVLLLLYDYIQSYYTYSKYYLL